MNNFYLQNYKPALNGLGQELNLTKVIKEQERQLIIVEKQFFDMLDTTLISAVAQIKTFKTELFKEIIDPLENEYAQSKDIEIYNFLKNIAKILGSYNGSITTAKYKFLIGLGGKRYYADYDKYIKKLYISYIPKFPQRPVKISYRKITQTAGLGAIPIISAVFRLFLTENITKPITEKLLSIPIIGDTIKGILTAVFEAYRGLWYLFKPDDKRRAKVIEIKAKYLEKANKFVEDGFNTIITAVDNMQSKIDKKLRLFSQTIEQKDVTAVPEDLRRVKPYMPYKIGKVTRQPITLPSGGRGVEVRYEREYIDGVDGVNGVDRLNGSPLDYNFSLLQYATGIFIPKVNFPYDRTTPDGIRRSLKSMRTGV